MVIENRTFLSRDHVYCINVLVPQSALLTYNQKIHTVWTVKQDFVPISIAVAISGHRDTNILQRLSPFNNDGR